MPGLTLALLGNLDARREFGKVGTQSDIHLHDLRQDGREVTTIVPARYPEQVKPLSYALLGADAAVLVLHTIDAKAGEQILAADAAGIAHGAVVLQDYLQPEQVQPLLRDTALAGWELFPEPDWPAVRSHVATAPETPSEGPPVVPVDHHFDVKGVGAVVLGVVRSGTLRKGDTLHAWPDKVICPVRSIQVHDVDVSEARPGDRVGLALRNVKADQLDRGQVLAPADADLSVAAAGTRIQVRLRRHKFARQSLATGAVVHLGLGMQFAPMRIESELPAAGTEAAFEATLEKQVVWTPGQRGILWHVDSAPQRVLGAAWLL